MTNQYAEEKSWVFSFDLIEESEEECLTQGGRDFQIIGPRYRNDFSSRFLLPFLGTRKIRVFEADRRDACRYECHCKLVRGCMVHTEHAPRWPSVSRGATAVTTTTKTKTEKQTKKSHHHHQQQPPPLQKKQQQQQKTRFKYTTFCLFTNTQRKATISRFFEPSHPHRAM